MLYFGLSALVRIGLFLAILPRAAFLSLALFLDIGLVSKRLNPALLWSGLLCSTLDWSALGFLVWFSLLRAVLSAVLALG